MRLLAPRSIHEMTREEYHEYVRGLYLKREKRKTARVKKEKKPFTWSLTKKGTLVLRITREPKWLSREEIDGIAAASGLPLNEVWQKVLDPKRGVRVSTQSEEDEIAKDIADFPW